MFEIFTVYNPFLAGILAFLSFFFSSLEYAQSQLVDKSLNDLDLQSRSKGHGSYKKKKSYNNKITTCGSFEHLFWLPITDSEASPLLRPEVHRAAQLGDNSSLSRSPVLRPEVPSPSLVEIEQEKVALFGRREREPGTPLSEFLQAINPIDTDGWSDMRFYAKAYEVFKVRMERCFCFLCLFFRYFHCNYYYNDKDECDWF